MQKDVWVVFSAAEREYGLETAGYLEEHGFAAREDVSEGLIRFSGTDETAVSSAVVFLSDSATEDQAWKETVGSIPAGFRVIPVGGTVQIDYNNPEVLPTRIQEINYISLDAAYLPNIMDALLIDPSFYSVKNDVLRMVDTWLLSQKDDSFLMPSMRKSQSYLRLFQAAASRARDPQVLQKEKAAQEFLRLSAKHALLRSVTDGLRYAKYLLYAVIGAAVLAALLFVRSYINRAFYSEILLGIDTRSENYVVNAIKTAEGLTNPFVPLSSKRQYYTYLSDLLERNWPNSPLGMGLYKWALNDVTASDDPRCLLTANGKGQAVLWDTYTGEITEREYVSDEPLAAIAVSAGNARTAIDGTGRVFYSEPRKAWHYSGISCPIVWTDAVRIMISDDGQSIAVIDQSQVFRLSVNESKISLQWSLSFDEIRAAALDEQGAILCLAASRDGWFVSEIDASGSETRFALPVTLHKICSADMTSGKAVFADEAGQVWIWQRIDPNTLLNTGLLLTGPIALCISDGDYLVYHDRNAGTQLYDYRQSIPLADCLPYAYAVRRLELSDNLVIGFSGSMIYSEDISALLPVLEITEPVLRTFSEKENADSGTVVRSVSIENEYMIKLELMLDTGIIVMIDPSTRFFIGEAEKDDSLEDGFPEEYSYYSALGVNFTGKPTVVGIVSEADTVLIAAFDGSFYEVCIAEDGGALIASHTKVPSHSPIVRIHQTETCYYLEDAAGNLWQKRIGYKAARGNYSVLLSEIRDKLHMSVDDELISRVSPQIAKALGLHRFSAPDGKEWE